MKFRRALQRYGRTPEPQTPYQRAGQVWDERIGSARVQASNWRLMALGGLMLSAGLSAGLLWLSSESRVTPYVVEVDHLGQAVAVAPADRPYRPTDPEIAWFLAHFIASVRSIPMDPVLMRQNWLSAYDFATERGARFLSFYARDANPFGQVGQRSVSVQVTSVVRASDTSFEVKWIESAYERGSLAGTSHWTAIVTVRLLVFQVSPMWSSLIRNRNGWTPITCLGAPGTYCSVIAAIMAGEDWTAVRCM